MNKTELINEMAKDLDSVTAAKAALDSILEQITHSMKKQQTIRLPDLGTFKVSKRKARKGRNPATGETITIKAKKAVRFLPAKKLKTAVQ